MMIFEHPLSWTDENIYNEIYKNSIDHNEQFWAHYKKYIDWKAEGITNVCYNCVDRHIKALAHKPAIVWYGDEANERIELTYEDLYKMIIQIAYILRRHNIKNGDVVGIYMPMIPEAIASMLACARIGAIHLVVFAGFSKQSLNYRLTESKAKAVITVTSFKRGGKKIDLSKNIPSGIDVIILDDVSYTAGITDYIEWQNTDDDLFILYTSGTSGKPKAITHSALPYMLYVATTFKVIFGIRDDDVYFCTSDIGWITGHSYITYAPLFYGLTNVIFSGSPTYPTADRYWTIIEKEKVSIFYTSPTAIRSLSTFNNDYVKRHDLSSLRVLGSVGEPINKSAWEWYFDIVGNKRCPIMDTWWQTETGGIVLAPLRNLNQKPGVAGKPFFGICVDIAQNELTIKNKFPGLCKSLKLPYKTGDEAQYVNNDIKINGRLDDVINISGHRLSVTEFENAISKLDAIKEVAVVAIPDELKGQTAFVYIVLRYDNIETNVIVNTIITATKTYIGAIAKPDYIAIVPDLPKTRSGKIMRKLLKDIATGNTEPLDTSSMQNPQIIEEIKHISNDPIFCPDFCKIKC